MSDHYVTPPDEKLHIEHNEQIRDHDLIDGLKNVPSAEAMHWGALDEHELAIEKKLRRRIDALIMPLVILVYLMNYIDRYDNLGPSPKLRCNEEFG